MKAKKDMEVDGECRDYKFQNPMGINKLRTEKKTCLSADFSPVSFYQNLYLLYNKRRFLANPNLGLLEVLLIINKAVL